MGRDKAEQGQATVATFYGKTEDEIIEAIESGRSIASIAEEMGRSRSNLSQWLRANPERSARAHEARERSADAYDEQAETEIRSAADPFSLAKAKELAHHLRWKASKIAPRRYGDKLALGGADDLPPIKTVSDEQLAARIKQLQSRMNDGAEQG